LSHFRELFHHIVEVGDLFLDILDRFPSRIRAVAMSSKLRVVQKGKLLDGLGAHFAEVETGDFCTGGTAKKQCQIRGDLARVRVRW
jgi:hypothetical protein